MLSVSVCVPCFNHGSHLRNALASVLAQDHEALEVIVGDDASQDETAQVIEDFEARDARVRSIRNTSTLGFEANVNRLLGAATGDFVVVLDADDVLLRTDYLSTAVRALRRAPGAGYFLSAARHVDANGAWLRTAPAVEHEGVAPAREVLDDFLSLRHPKLGTAVLRRCVVAAAGGLPEHQVFAADLRWLIGLTGPADVIRSATEYTTFRQANDSLSASIDPASMLASYRALLLDVVERFAEDLRLSATIERSLEELERCARSTRERPELELTMPIEQRIERWRHEGTRLLLHGAGSHTARLMADHDFTGVRVVGLADRDPALAGRSLHGHRVVSPAVIPDLRPDAVLISAREEQDEVYVGLRGFLPETIRVVRLYGPRPLGLAC